MSNYPNPKPSIKYPWQESPAFYGAVALVVAVLVTAGLSVSGVFHSMHLW
jgi:hypothetical protein